MSDIGRHFLYFGRVNDEYGEKPRVVVRTFSDMFERGKAADGALAASFRSKRAAVLAMSAAGIDLYRSNAGKRQPSSEVAMNRRKIVRGIMVLKPAITEDDCLFSA